MHWDGNWHLWWMSAWWIVIALVLLVVARFVLVALRREGGGPESPEQILKRRYASGEIDRETYERMLRNLRK